MSNIHLFFVGDFCSLVSPEDIMVKSELASMIQNADISVCNFETPVKPTGYVVKQDPTFTNLYQSFQSVGFLEKSGFDLFSLANNHTFDCGDEGYHETLKHIKKAQYLGAGTFEDAFKVKVIEKKGLKIGFMALTYASFGVFDNTSDGHGLGCAYINHPCVNHVIQKSKNEVDCLIVLAHDGIEYTNAPTWLVRNRYHELIDNGADAVIACHPHCPQGWEDYEGRPIFYSLGNFFFNSKTDPAFKTPLPFWYNGLAVSLSVDCETKKMSFEVYNTIVNGRTISIDDSKEIKEHNDCLCSILNDNSLFESYWSKTTADLLKQKYLPFCEYTFNTPIKRKGIKGVVKTVLDSFTPTKEKSFKRFYFILRSDTEREVFLNGLKQVYKFN
jgi:poly-gamma-glutamate synthesis protein (capsule biosynthesis protein)